MNEVDSTGGAEATGRTGDDIEGDIAGVAGGGGGIDRALVATTDGGDQTGVTIAGKVENGLTDGDGDIASGADGASGIDEAPGSL